MLFVLVILTIFTITLITHYMYFEFNPISTLLLNIFFIFEFGSLTISLFKENSDKAKIKSQYDNVINNSEKYEKIIDQLRMSNHENKNNLVVLRE